VARKDAKILLSELNDLNRSELKSKIAYEDPRTSSPGLQFLMWVSQSFSETQAISFLKKIESDSHSISPSWSAAYGLFKNRNVDYVLSYITSPIYHLVEENDPNYIAFDFKEGLPLQIEFVGVADKCMSCEAAYQFVTYLQSAEAQSLIMKKNYMLPIEKNIVESTAFDTLTKYNFLPYKPITKDEINKWLRIWSEIKKNDI
jgi:thiamine transport system substrate-binding protein